MFNKFYGLLLLTLLLLLLSVSSVTAADNNTDSLTTVGDNSLQLNNTSNSIVNLTNNYNYSIANNTTNLNDVPCAVSVYISVMESYNKTVDVETGIKETHTVDNITSVDGLVNAFTKYGINCTVLKNNIENLKELHKDKRNNIIVHMLINNDYHFGHIKKIKENYILFNNNWFVPFDCFKKWYTNNTIVITNGTYLNINSFGLNVNKSNWVNITGKLTQRELFNHNYGLIGKSITLNNKYVKLKANLDDSHKKGFDFAEHVLFADTLKPKMANLLKIQGQLEPIYNNPNAPPKLLTDLNNILTPMQKNLNKTISDLNYLINMIKEHCNKDTNFKSFNVGVNPIKQVDVPKLLGDCGEAITENSVLKQFIKNFEDSVNRLNPLNAHPELREKLDQKYGLEQHKFGFIDCYTLKK